MSFRLKENDCKTLELIAEYRMLIVTQIAAIFHKSRQVVRRRLNNLEEAGLIEITGREFGRGRGRPENSLGLTEHGIDILKERGSIGQDVPYEKVCADCLFCVDHQLLLNWFRIHLNHVEKVVPRISVKLFAHNSPFLPKGQSGRILIADYTPVRPAKTKIKRVDEALTIKLKPTPDILKWAGKHKNESRVTGHELLLALLWRIKTFG